MNRLYFRKSQKVVLEDDFGRVLSRKCFVCSRMLRLYAAPNGLEIPRFGVSVSQNCGKAVVRNRLKRLAREAFRVHQHEIPAGYDYILIFTLKLPKKGTEPTTATKKSGAPMQYKEVESLLLRMIQNLIKEKSQ